MKRSIKKNRIFSVAACFLLPLLATSAFAQQCVGDRAWRAAENGTNGTGNAVHANALYRSLITFQSEVDTPLPVWPSRHGTAPTETITARELAEVRGPWGGFDHVIEALTCLEAKVETVEATDTVETVTVDNSPDNSPQPLVDPVQEQAQTDPQAGWPTITISLVGAKTRYGVGAYSGQRTITYRLTSTGSFTGKVKVQVYSRNVGDWVNGVVVDFHNITVDTLGGIANPGSAQWFYVDMDGTTATFTVTARGIERKKLVAGNVYSRVLPSTGGEFWKDQGQTGTENHGYGYKTDGVTQIVKFR